MNIHQQNNITNMTFESNKSRMEIIYPSKTINYKEMKIY